ncbi:ribosome silencing factor [Undibacterium sp. TJN25]|uniref:ribosome silencing factor n=1 Tax=Undibacterium sp. TJN25 TaxID=3413056 RepID=UPI003BF27EE7
MDIKKLQTLVIDALEDVKAQEIKVYDTAHLTSLFDRIAIASGTSNRQTKALAASVRDKVKENGGHIISVEGETTGEWVLVDLGDMIVHIMQPAIRAYYRLEEIWGDKEIKLGAAKRISKRTASEPEEEEKPKRARKVGEVEVTHTMQATQTTLDDEPKKTRKPRATTAKAVADAVAKPARKPAVRKTAAATEGAPAPRKTTAKAPAGARVKVAATKTATASAKQAATKRATTTKRKTAE